MEVWDVTTDTTIAKFSHGAAVKSITWIGLRQIASAGNDGKVNIWNLDMGKKTKSLSHDEKFCSLAFSPQTNLLAAGLVRQHHQFGM